MHRLLFSSLVAVVIAVTPLRAAFSAEDDLSGFTMQQLHAALTKGGLATQKIYSIQTFDSEDRYGSNIAILASSHSGWRIAVLHRIKGGLEVEWQLGKLPPDIVVSSSNNLKIERLDDGEQVVEFSGCVQHQCGGVEGILGVLLYSSHAKQVFFAHYRYDEGKPIGSYGSLDFSKNANARGNEKYKAALQRKMKEELGQ